MVRTLDALEPTRVFAGSGAGSEIASPFFSPDGSEIGFYDNSTIPPVLRRVSIRGGAASLITVLDGALRGASWGEDGRIVFGTATRRESVRATGLWRVPAAGGEAELLTTPDAAQGELDHVMPELLPGGRAVLFTIARAEGPQVAVLELDTGTYRPLVDGAFPRYASTGHVLYGLEGTIWAVRFDLDRLETVGAPVPVQEGVVTKGVAATEMALGRDGSLLYVAARGDGAAREPVWVDRSGREEPIDIPGGFYGTPRISRDGTRMVIWGRDESLDSNLWVYQRARGTFERLTVDPGENADPIWSPDGTRIAYYTDGREGGAGIFLRAADGTGAVERLTTGNHRPTSWSNDDEIVFMELDERGRRAVATVGMVSVGGEGEGRPLLTTTGHVGAAVVSPDGRWLAYAEDASGETGLEIYVRPFPHVDEARTRISTAGGEDPAWAPDGSSLFYRDDSTIMEVTVGEGVPASWSEPVALFEGQFVTSPAYDMHFDVDTDGQRFVMIKTWESGGLVLVWNFFTELERLVPTD